MQKYRQEQKQITYQKILTASYELFHANGYDDTSYTQIAKRALVGYGTVYAHFKTKEDMLIAQMYMLLQMHTDNLEKNEQGDRSHLEYALYLVDRSWHIISELPPRLLSAYMAHRWKTNKDTYNKGKALHDSLLGVIETHFIQAQTEGALSADIDIPKHMFIMDACYVKATQTGRFCEGDLATAKAEFDAQLRYLLRID